MIFPSWDTIKEKCQRECQNPHRARLFQRYRKTTEKPPPLPQLPHLSKTSFPIKYNKTTEKTPPSSGIHFHQSTPSPTPTPSFKPSYSSLSLQPYQVFPPSRSKGRPKHPHPHFPQIIPIVS